MNPNLDLSIVVCTHNRYQVLDKALKSIETQDIPASSFELIVVDNSTEKDIQAHFHS
jgi:glycosyltransferase involved in cell wall biosynthesis